jgi:hypothetical protein
VNLRRSLLACLLAVSASPAVAREACTPEIVRPWIRSAPPGAAMLAGYLELRNPCREPVRVVGVESLDFAHPSIHRSSMENGVSRMRAAGELLVPARGSLRFEPGGLHLMLMGASRPLREGDRARLRLLLADGRRLFAEFPVRREAPP